MHILQRLFFSDIFISFAAICAHAQQKVLYKSYDGHLVTKRQVDSVVAQINQRGKAQGMGAYFEIEEKALRHDTLIYTYSVTRASQGMVNAHHRQEAFIGKPLPAFSLRDLNGQLVKSASLLGRPVVLNLWFVNCTGCVMEMPELNRTMAAPENKSMTFLALTYEKPDKVRAFLRKRPFTFRHLPDAQQYCDIFTQAYPITIFVDKQGIIRSIHGPLSYISAEVHTAHRAPAPDGQGYLDTTALHTALDGIR